MSRHFLALSLSLSMLVVTASASCSNEEINKASQEFKDCVDKKEFELIHMDRNQEDVQSFICDKLEEISSDCHRALAKCRSREYVDDKVAIHINSISGKKKTPPSSLFSKLTKNQSPRFPSSGQREAQGTTNFLKDPWKYFSQWVFVREVYMIIIVQCIPHQAQHHNGTSFQNRRTSYSSGVHRTLQTNYLIENFNWE